MRKVLFILGIALLLGDSLNEFKPIYSIQIVDAASEIEGREDLMGRNEYLSLLQADPSTGLVPEDIRVAELQFDKRLTTQTAQLRTEALTIESAGPVNVGGRTRAVAFDVRDENIILAGGVSGGVWKSQDGGATWVRKSNPENRNSVTCIVQDTRPGKEDIWYHGTGEIVGNSARGGSAPFRGNGIYKSTDNGETWNALTSTQDSEPNIFNSQFQYIWDIETNPENLDEDEVLVAAYGGILRSLDGGNTWQVEVGQELYNLDESVDLNESNASFYTSLERSEDNVFYAALSSESGTSERSPEAGIYYSLNGDDWANITPLTDESQYRRTVIGSSPSNPDITYFMIDSSPIFIIEHKLSQLNNPNRINGFDPNPRVIPEFDVDQGDLNTQGSYNMMIRVHPTNENIVFIGGTNLFRSTDGFRTSDNIKWIGGYDPDGSGVYVNHHPDQHDLLFLPRNPDAALSASDGGLIKTSDIRADSVMWESSNSGFVTSQFFTIAQSKTIGDEALIGGMQDNGTDLTRNGSTSWNGIIGGDGAYAATTKDDQLWLASFQRGQTLRITLNDGQSISSFGRVDPGGLVQKSGSLYLFVNPFILDPINQNRMFCGGGNHLYFHPNISQIPGGSQIPTNIGWKKVNDTALTNGLVSAVEASFDGEKVFFGTSSGRVFRLDNARDETAFDLQEISSNEFPFGAYVSSIAVNPDDNQHLLVVFSNYSVPSIFESTDGGISFTDISGNLEENTDGSGNGPSVRWAEIVPKNSGTLRLVGTSVGLYTTESTSGTTTWIKESPALLGSAIVTMMDYRPGDGRLAIATHGNGVFTTNIPDFKALMLEEEEVNTFELVAAYPNPFNQDTQIQYRLPEDGEVRVDILTSNGSLINTILWAPQYAGTNTVSWDGNNASGTSLANGIYFYRVQYQGQSLSGRLLLRR
ncbi:FlgD immunoglobulin-like domain containing protein [Ekhidna sp. To15]|uniref:FlgD immunoglobulin-like domain containing protein n=1 Tax=Ekhidna sp. To15 TaxID=3395267 RepID=UPI003F523976